MTIENMTLSEIQGSEQSGVVYNKTLTLSGAVTSNAISLPETKIQGIAVQISTTGVCTLYATAGAPAQIADDTNVWEAWDGYSEINPACTALYVDNASGDSTVVISVRGA